MIEDKELDAELEKRKALVEAKKVTALDESAYVADAMKTAFANKMDDVKQNVLEDASENDAMFKNQIKENVKEAAVKLTEVEKEKADYAKQQVGYESAKLETKENKEKHQQKEDKWLNRQKRREFHFNGVKPIMSFVGITEPMNLFFLYLFALVLLVPFFISKLFRGTIGVLLAGAEDGNRSKTAKAFIWTIIAVAVALLLFVLVYLFLKWQGIDILRNIK